MICLLAAVVLACDSGPDAGTEMPPSSDTTEVAPSGAAPVISMPATYEGVIPCADCPGIRYSLTLQPDGIALQGSTYLEVEDSEDVAFVELLTWDLVDDGGRLALGADPEIAHSFAIVDEKLNYDLVRAEEMDSIEGPLSLRGHYRYLADAATFEECRTGRRFPVSMEADNAFGQVHADGRCEEPAP